MALKKIQLDAVADHVQFLISAMAQPITKSQEAALEGLKKSLSDVFNSIEGVQVEDNNSQSDETVKTIESLKKEIEALKSAVNDSDKKAMNSLEQFSHVIEDNREKIKDIESRQKEAYYTDFDKRIKKIEEKLFRGKEDSFIIYDEYSFDPNAKYPVIKVFKGKEEIKGVELEYSNAKLPEKHYDSDSGFDGFVCFADGFQTEETIQPGETKRIPLGIQCEIPEGYEIQVRPRSGNTGKRINVGWGTVDSKYIGILKVNVSNDTKEPYVVKQGDKICQLVIGKVIPAKMVFAKDGETIKPTERGSNGFGSSGR